MLEKAGMRTLYKRTAKDTGAVTFFLGRAERELLEESDIYIREVLAMSADIQLLQQMKKLAEGK